MYLSRVEINPRLQSTMRALNSPQRMHAIVAASFPISDGLSSPDPSFDLQRSIWRIDKVGYSLFVLVASPIKPDFRHLIEQLGWPASGQKWETKSYDPFLASLQSGQEWQFRLRANPTCSIKSEGAPQSRGRLVACSSIDDQKEWLAKRSTKHGFSLNGFELVDRTISKFERKQKEVTLHMATFEGLLRVENPELLGQVLVAGLGRAKAYGCGLLTLANPHAGA